MKVLCPESWEDDYNKDRQCGDLYGDQDGVEGRTLTGTQDQQTGNRQADDHGGEVDKTAGIGTISQHDRDLDAKGTFQ